MPKLESVTPIGNNYEIVATFQKEISDKPNEVLAGTKIEGSLTEEEINYLNFKDKYRLHCMVEGKLTNFFSK